MRDGPTDGSTVDTTVPSYENASAAERALAEKILAPHPHSGDDLTDPESMRLMWAALRAMDLPQD